MQLQLHMDLFHCEKKPLLIPVYVDAGKPGCCNDLVFQLGANAAAGTVTRQWSIKVTQYSCDYNNLAPKGCTQYFFGAESGTVMSYNFEGGTHLANQNQQICIRQERGSCRVCWVAVADADFKTSGMVTKMAHNKFDCCNFGVDGVMTNFDCVMIPGARKVTMTSMLGPESFCGRTAGLASKSSATMGSTICSKYMLYLTPAFICREKLIAQW